MDNYRHLTDEEIIALENNGCTAEDWTCVCVADDFKAAYVHDVRFYGTVNLGIFERDIEVADGFARHSGLHNVTLRNVTIGDNCLIENIGCHINNYSIGDECCIINTAIIETTAETTFGEGNTIAVLNEAGSGNVTLFRGLTSNIAALMVANVGDKQLTDVLRMIIQDDINRRLSPVGTIGNNARIVNTGEITNTNIAAGCEINGACRLSDCTIAAEPDDGVFIGTGVICENTIITDGSSVLNGSKLFNCFVGESCRITNGFTAESSLFFANTHMANGEACAAFCGPFSASHHKSSLLIGCMTSFYNAGSATNFSNHAYKMGPIHYGVLERGTKTASSSHILLPATIGAFSVCLGKISDHPDTTLLPFSYIIGDGKTTTIVPGRNLVTAGLYRDTQKWPKRDMRIKSATNSRINHHWLNPITVGMMMNGYTTLARLRQEQGEDATEYTFGQCKISPNSLRRGLRLYAMAIEMFIGQTLATHNIDENLTTSASCPDAVGIGEWHDLSGLLIPAEEERRIIGEIKNGNIADITELTDALAALHNSYDQYLQAFTHNLMYRYLGKTDITTDDRADLIERGHAARAAWLGEIRHDAEKEFDMGDVDETTLNNFLNKIRSEE